MSNKEEEIALMNFGSLIHKRLNNVAYGQERDCITITAPLDKNDWITVVPIIKKCLDESGYGEFFRIAGSGLFIGGREVLLCRKPNAQ